MLSNALILALHELDEIDDSAGVAELVVIPRDELDELVVEGDTSEGVEDARARVADKVRRDDLVLRVAEDAVEGSTGCGGLLHLVLDLLVGGRLAEPDRQVDDRDVGYRHAEGHTGELAIQGRDYLADGLRSSRRRGDDVLGGTTTVAPQLQVMIDTYSPLNESPLQVHYSCVFPSYAWTSWNFNKGQSIVNKPFRKVRRPSSEWRW
jgi:hypothetical protein